MDLNGPCCETGIVVAFACDDRLPERISRVTHALDMNAAYVPCPDAMESRLGEETVILHLGSGTYFGLDAVGTLGVGGDGRGAGGHACQPLRPCAGVVFRCLRHGRGGCDRVSAAAGGA